VARDVSEMNRKRSEEAPRPDSLDGIISED
jgi:hypothetical protein